jgi:hypothetical protein
MAVHRHKLGASKWYFSVQKCAKNHLLASWFKFFSPVTPWGHLKKEGKCG